MRSVTLSLAIFAAFICALSMAEPAWAQPNGSYLQSCRDVRVAGKYRPDALLLAECQTRKGSWRESSLYYKSCRGDIYNDNGTLRCQGGQAGNPGSLPPGQLAAPAAATPTSTAARCMPTAGRSTAAGRMPAST